MHAAPSAEAIPVVFGAGAGHAGLSFAPGVEVGAPINRLRRAPENSDEPIAAKGALPDTRLLLCVGPGYCAETTAGTLRQSGALQWATRFGRQLCRAGEAGTAAGAASDGCEAPQLEGELGRDSRRRRRTLTTTESTETEGIDRQWKLADSHGRPLPRWGRWQFRVVAPAAVAAMEKSGMEVRKPPPTLDRRP